MMAIIFKNYKKLFLALALSLIVLFFAARPAQAFIGTGIFDWAMSAMGGLADLGGWSFALFFGLFIALSLSTALVGIAAWLLEWSINLPINVMQNPIVDAGWNFTLGLANLSFVLIFVFIALAFIFNRETLEMKKALPRLIIIALLVNFSRLFVGIFADIATILSNTIIQGAGTEGLASQTLSALTGSAGKLISSLAIMLGTSAALLAIPFVDVFTMIARIGLSLIYLPNLVTGFFLIFFNVVISIIYLLYSVLFVARVVVFWLLAIFAPLAFIAFILPATKKYWDDWFKTLLSWTFLGVIALLLVALGLKLIGALFAAGGGITINPLGAWGNLTKFIGYYFLLAVYLIIALTFSKKMAPKGAEIVWNAGSVGFRAGTAWGSGMVAKYARRAGAELQERRAGAATRAEQMIAAGQRPTLRQRMWTGEWRGRPGQIRAIKELSEAKSQMFRGMQIKEQRSKLLAKTKDMDEETAKTFLSAEALRHGLSPERLRDKSKSAALVELLAEKDTLKDQHMNLYLEAWKNAGPDDAQKNRVKKAVLAKRLDWGTYNERKARLEKMNVSDIDKLSAAAKENDTVIKEVVGTLRPDFITRFGSQTKISMQKVQKEVDDTIGKAWRDLGAGMNDIRVFTAHVATLNADQKRKLLQQLEAIRYIHHSSATQGINWKKYGSVEKGASDYVQDRIEEIRKALP